MADVEEVRMEAEAVQAVYGDDCWVIEDFPPHLSVHIKPRTGDDSSQQFVEVTLGIKTNDQYPKEPPHVYIVEEKGLDEKRQEHLISIIQNKAWELSTSPMLVALCEEAVEVLSNMNHPDGDCPLCLYPFLVEDNSGTSLPFMKLMSCYHCFHSECIIRWWKWQQECSENEGSLMEEPSARSAVNAQVMHSDGNQTKGICPVCRKVFNAKDIEHVTNYLAATLSQLGFTDQDAEEDAETFLHSESEINRRQKFEALLKLQQEHSGLIEPKKELLILPGMYLPQNSTSATTSSETSNEQCGDNADSQAREIDPNSLVNKAVQSKHRNSSTRRRPRGHSSRRQPHAQSVRQQWIRKEDTLQQ